MHEKRFCLNCGSVGQMTIHGECETCGSTAVVLPESIYSLTATFNKSVDECERIFAMKGTK